MMANSIYGLPDYYRLFASPVKTSQMSSLSNFIYGSSVGKVYSQTLAKKLESQMSSYLSSMNSNITNLKTFAKTLKTSGINSSFEQKQVNSTDTTSIAGMAASNADNASYTLNVSKLATSQVNIGTGLNSNEKNFTTGLNTIAVKIGSNTAKNISFSVNADDTNNSVLNKMAKSINSANTGINANVITDTKTNTNYLKITSNKTGSENTFSLSDITGNAVSISDTNKVSSVSTDAHYSINGKSYTSSSNNVTLNNGKVNLTLQKAEGKDINLTVSSNTSAIKSDIKKFISGYNSAIEFANSNSSDFKGAANISKELGNVINSKKISLSNIGISINSDKTLSIDETKFDNALKNNLDKVKSLFSGNEGIANKVTNKSNEILTSPLKYSKADEIANFLSNQYTADAAKSAAFPYSYKGLIVDSLF